VVQVAPRSWTHLLAELSGQPLDPQTQIPQTWRELVPRRTGLQPPESLTDEAPAAYRAWDAGEGDCDDPLDRAVAAARRAVFPEHPLDPLDPR
jgi:acetoin utilization protein AcuC